LGLGLLLTGKGYHALPAPDGTAAAATWRLLIKNGTVFLVLLPGAQVPSAFDVGRLQGRPLPPFAGVPSALRSL